MKTINRPSVLITVYIVRYVGGWFLRWLAVGRGHTHTQKHMATKLTKSNLEYFLSRQLSKMSRMHKMSGMNLFRSILCTYYSNQTEVGIYKKKRFLRKKKKTRFRSRKKKEPREQKVKNQYLDHSIYKEK